MEYQRAKYLKHREIIHVYAGKDANGDDVIVKADGSTNLLRNSILTPSLFGSIFESKYVNAQPLKVGTDDRRIVKHAAIGHR